MNTIVMNTLTGAVSEYTDFNFHAVTPDYAGSAVGLYALGGNLDVLSLIVAEVKTGKTQWGDSHKTQLDGVYFALPECGTAGRLTVNEFSYDFTCRTSGESRGVPGKGIRENYLAFGFKNPDGAYFKLDKIEVRDVRSARRV